MEEHERREKLIWENFHQGRMEDESDGHRVIFQP